MTFVPLIIIGSVFLLDQLTKYLVCHFSSLLPFSATSFFNIVFTQNRGMSFGLFNNSSSIIFYLVTGVVITLCGYLFYWLWKEKNKLIRLGLSAIIGGALGNLYDRFLRGGVVDFLDFHIESFHWPAFNVADSFIFIGVIVLLWADITNKKQRIT